ncbi:MAG TPA: ABC transporter ATP-binding protein, partial [Bacteroidia bacterium]|nr:ABC transporter ATP-binding protein [Bacteroidia bacterium]
MIRIENLTKRFGKLTALIQISLSLERGKCFALIGPNASGKTTLIKSVLGLVFPEEGKIFINDASIIGEWEYKNQIGYMPQIGRYPENISIQQLFNMLIDIRQTSWEKCDTDLHSRFEIENINSKKLGTLSGGTRQKISASLAFLFNPEILILDEPTAGLDPVSTEMLKEKIIKEKAKGKLILITSHVLSDLDELVDEVIFLQDGQISFQKNISTLRGETGETKLSRAIAKVMGYKEHESIQMTT